jgi:tetratricopeptide (TPR) repeat protein
MADHSADASIREGYLARREHRLAEAEALFARAVEQCWSGAEPRILARALTGLGQVERDLGNTTAAVRHYEEAIAIYRTETDPLALAHAVRHLGDIRRNRGELKEAAGCYDVSLEIYRKHSETPPLDLANALRGYALLKAQTGDTQESARIWREAGALYESLGIEAGVAESRESLAQLGA